MDHEQASLLLTEYAEGSLDPSQTQAVQEHVAGCADCTDVLQALADLRSLSDAWPSLLRPHPEPDLLSQWTLGSPPLPLEMEAQIASHVRVCPTCTTELHVVRGSIRAADRWWSGWRSRLSLTDRVWVPSLVPVGLTAIIVVLAVPTLRQLGNRADLGPTGMPPTFDLGSATRGQATRLEVEAQTPQQLLLIDYPARVQGPPAPSGAIQVQLFGAGPEPVWTSTGAWSTLFSPESRVLSLILPTAVLRRGPHRLQIDWGIEAIPPSIYEIDVLVRD